jgi:hypothetical protein
MSSERVLRLPCARPKIRINGDLRGTPRVDVIGRSGEKIGVMTLSQALRLALKEGLDLVEVNPRADPPVCKVLDFARYTYEGKKNVLWQDGLGSEKTTPSSFPSGPMSFDPLMSNGRLTL